MSDQNNKNSEPEPQQTQQADKQKYQIKLEPQSTSKTEPKKQNDNDNDNDDDDDDEGDRDGDSDTYGASIDTDPQIKMTTDQTATQNTTSSTIKTEKRGRPKGAKNRPKIIQPFFSQSPYDNGPEEPKISGDAPLKHKIPEKRKVSKKSTEKLLKVIFEIENNMIKMIDPTLQLKQDSIDVMVSACEDPLTEALGNVDFADKYMAPLIAAGTVGLIHLPIVVAVADKVKNRRSRNKNKGKVVYDITNKNEQKNSEGTPKNYSPT